MPVFKMNDSDMCRLLVPPCVNHFVNVHDRVAEQDNLKSSLLC